MITATWDCAHPPLPLTARIEKTLFIISEVAGRPVGSIHPEAELVADLGIDSPKALHLLVEIEDALGVEISDEHAAQLRTVADVLRLVDETTAH